RSGQAVFPQPVRSDGFRAAACRRSARPAARVVSDAAARLLTSPGAARRSQGAVSRSARDCEARSTSMQAGRSDCVRAKVMREARQRKAEVDAERRDVDVSRELMTRTKPK